MQKSIILSLQNKREIYGGLTLIGKGVVLKTTSSRAIDVGVRIPNLPPQTPNLSNIYLKDIWYFHFKENTTFNMQM